MAGTTSIQRYLKQHFGSELPSKRIWYPMPTERGPGHAALAFDLLDSGFALGDVVAQAKAAGTTWLIVSSEDLDTCYSRSRSMERLAAALGDHALHLLVTLNSPISRAASSWQESIKHGNPHNFDEWWPTLLKNPGYQPDFVRRYTEALRPEKVSVVFSCRKAPPHQLLIDVLKALSLPINVEGNVTPANVRLGYLECEVLRHLNQLLLEHGGELSKADKRRLRSPLVEIMRSKQWAALCPAVPIQVPPPLLNQLANMAQCTLDDINELTKAWPVSIHGEQKVMLGGERTVETTTDTLSWIG